MTPTSQPRFVWDTSALLAAWVERYPIDVLPQLWANVGTAIEAGEMVAPDEVATELSKRSTDLLEFLEPHREFFLPTDVGVLSAVSEILVAHPRLVMERKRAFAADPFVIATARMMKLTVVTEEGRGSLGRPKITDVCDVFGVRCIGVLDLIRSLGWRF